MRILAIHNRYLISGGEDSVFEAEVSLLRRQGHEVKEFIESNQKLLKEPGWKSALNAVWSSSTYRALTETILDFRPEIAHFHNTFLRISPSAYYACRKLNVPVVQTLHNYRLLCPAAVFYRDGRICEDCLAKFIPYPGLIHGCWQESSIKTLAPVAVTTIHRFLRTWDNQIDMYIALTEFAKRKFVQGGLPEAKIVVKPNFVSTPFIQVEPRQDFFLFVGRLSPEKGILTLLNAWKNLKHVRLIIVGDGSLYSDIQNFKQTHELHNVEVLGRRPRDEVLALMQKAACLVFPSECYEGFPVTLIEAFACGLPVIASNLGGMREIVVDGENGLFFNPGDPIDLASKINWMLEHSARVEQMRSNARKAYEKKYTPEQNYQMLMQIYEQLLERSKEKLL